MKKLICAISLTINALILTPTFAANSKPQTVSVTPSSASPAAGETVTLVTVYSDPDGYADLKEARILINRSNLMAKCFYAYYDRSTNKLYLRNDAGSQWLGGFAPGSANSIENSYVTLDCRSTTVASSGAQLTIGWSIAFKASFTGQKYVLLYALDNSGAYSGWIKNGTCNILPSANHSPEITQVSPGDGATFLTGAKITFQITATDQDSDPLEYQFSVGGSVKQAWSNKNIFVWQTAQPDTGSIGITCEVRDNQTAPVSRTLSIYLINPAPEEALEKLAQNYSGIHDFTADMVLTSSLNGKPFGEPQYCRYYFKAPDKEKTITFSDENRNVKTNILISNGSIMHLIDPASRKSETVNLLEESGADSTQFSQMDIYYGQAKFLSGHTVTRNQSGSDPNNLIVALDATPNQTNNLYSQLQLYIDFKKGLLVKIIQKKEGEEPQILEATETAEVAPGIWMPTKARKNPNLSAGNFIAEISYSNIQLNLGLQDIEFTPQTEY